MGLPLGAARACWPLAHPSWLTPPLPRPHPHQLINPLPPSQATDIKETDTAYELKADIPGLSKEDVKIRLTPDRVLQVCTGSRVEFV